MSEIRWAVYDGTRQLTTKKTFMEAVEYAKENITGETLQIKVLVRCDGGIDAHEVVKVHNNINLKTEDNELISD